MKKSAPFQTKRGKVRALRNWIETVQITSGRLFWHIKKGGPLEHVREVLNDRALFYILRRYIAQAELTGKKLTPHSFRATFATLLSSNGSMASKFKRAAAGAITRYDERLRPQGERVQIQVVKETGF